MTQERNCENCAHYHMEAYEWPCNVCEASYDNPPTKWEEPEDKPQTNADHIRAMTDEELAHFLAWHWNKKDYGLEWLKQPAE